MQKPGALWCLLLNSPIAGHGPGHIGEGVSLFYNSLVLAVWASSIQMPYYGALSGIPWRSGFVGLYIFHEVRGIKEKTVGLITK